MAATTVLRPGVDLSVLTADQMKALDQMRDLFKNETYPDQEDPSSWFQLEDWTYLRYLRARKYDVPKAEFMLRDTLEFRRRIRPHAISPDEPAMRKYIDLKIWFLLPPSLQHDAVQFIEAGLLQPNDVGDETEFERYLVMANEVACRELVKGGWKAHTFLIVFDYRFFSLVNTMHPTSLRATKTMIEIGDLHYPELLKRSLVYNAPYMFRIPFQLLRPFMAQATLDKIALVTDNKAFDEYLSKESRVERHGGTRKQDAYASIYWEG